MSHFYLYSILIMILGLSPCTHNLITDMKMEYKKQLKTVRVTTNGLQNSLETISSGMIN